MSYASTIAADAPVNWWRLADPGGVIGRDIGSRREDALVSLPSSTTVPYVEPVLFSGPSSDGAAKFFLVNGYLWQVAPPVVPKPASVELWVFQLDGTTAGNQELFDWQDAGGGNGVRFELIAAPSAFVSVSGALGFGTVALTYGHWHHVVITDDTVTSKVFVDAITIATNPSAGAGNLGGGKRALGRGAPPIANLSRTFLADVAVYGSALSPARVTAHFLAADTAANAPVQRGNSGSDSSEISAILAAVINNLPSLP